MKLIKIKDDNHIIQNNKYNQDKFACCVDEFNKVHSVDDSTCKYGGIKLFEVLEKCKTFQINRQK